MAGFVPGLLLALLSGSSLLNILPRTAFSAALATADRPGCALRPSSTLTWIALRRSRDGRLHRTRPASLRRLQRDRFIRTVDVWLALRLAQGNRASPRRP